MVSIPLNASLAKQYGSNRLGRMLKEAFDKGQLSADAASAIVRSFESECCVVFSDISGFSRRVSDYAPSAVKDFLDAYYSRLLPIVYEHGGLVDQMMGDGVISVYSKELVAPGRIKNSVFDAGLKAAKAIVEEFSGDDQYTTKCALHKGRAVVCLLGSDSYQQATLVGNLMTSVYRVESVAREESVCMLMSIPEAAQRYSKVCLQSKGKAPAPWQLGAFNAQLQGMGTAPHEILCFRFDREAIS